MSKAVGGEGRREDEEEGEGREEDVRERREGKDGNTTTGAEWTAPLACDWLGLPVTRSFRY